MKRILLTTLVVTLLAGCVADGRNIEGQYAGITISHLKMSRLNACEAEFQSLTDKLSGKASALAESRINPRVVIRQVHSKFVATPEVGDNIITINPKLCQTGITQKTRYVIAHELGHFVAHMRHLPRGNSFTYVGVHQISKTAELDADNFARQILEGAAGALF